MFSNTGFVGNNYRWFIGQVPPKKNQYQGDVKWSDAWGDRVKVRIPGIHPADDRITNDDLPWAIVAKPTSHGHFNGGSIGIMGGEWVLGFFLDETNQVPIITHVLGVNIVDSPSNNDGYFKHVSRFKGNGLNPGNAEVSGGSAPTTPAKPTKQEFEKAKEVNPSEREIGDIYTDNFGNRFEVTGKNKIEGDFNSDGTNKTFNIVRKLN